MASTTKSLIDEMSEALAILLGVDPATIDPVLVANFIAGNTDALTKLIDELDIQITTEEVETLTSAVEEIPDSALETLLTVATEQEVESVLESILGLGPGDLKGTQVVSDTLAGDPAALLGVLEANGLELNQETVTELSQATDKIPETTLGKLQKEAEKKEIEQALANVLRLDKEDLKSIAEGIQNEDGSSLLALIETRAKDLTSEEVNQLRDATNLIPEPIIQLLASLAEDKAKAKLAKEAIAGLADLDSSAEVPDTVAQALLQGQAEPLLELIDDTAVELSLESISAFEQASDGVPNSILDVLKTRMREQQQAKVQAALQELLGKNLSQTMAEDLLDGDPFGLLEVAKEKGIPKQKVMEFLESPAGQLLPESVKEAVAQWQEGITTTTEKPMERSTTAEEGLSPEEKKLLEKFAGVSGGIPDDILEEVKTG